MSMIEWLLRLFGFRKAPTEAEEAEAVKKQKEEDQLRRLANARKAEEEATLVAQRVSAKVQVLYERAEHARAEYQNAGSVPPFKMRELEFAAEQATRDYNAAAQEQKAIQQNLQMLSDLRRMIDQGINLPGAPDAEVIEAEAERLYMKIKESEQAMDRAERARLIVDQARPDLGDFVPVSELSRIKAPEAKPESPRTEQRL